MYTSGLYTATTYIIKQQGIRAWLYFNNRSFDNKKTRWCKQTHTKHTVLTKLSTNIKF